MRPLILLAAVLAVLLSSTAMAAPAQKPEWQLRLEEAMSLYEQGRYEQAIAAETQALRAAESMYGPEHAVVATMLNFLAILYGQHGESQQAEPVYLRALKIREKLLGPEHPDVATTLGSLGASYLEQGRYAQAEPLLKRALAIQEKTLGRDHPKTAQHLNNLAGLYQALGHYAQAEPLLQRALAIQEKALGPEHPDVALALNSLAGLYSSRGQFAQAETLMKRALSIYEKALGAAHPELVVTLNNLADNALAQDNHGQSELLLKRALAIVESKLGLEHFRMATILGRLADVYDATGRPLQAEPLWKRALEIEEKTLGPDHPNVAKTLKRLARFYALQGKYPQAEPLFQRSLAIQEKSLGSAHPDLGLSLNGLGSLYAAQSRYAQAEPLYRRALAILEKTYGPEHPGVATILNNLSVLYQNQGQKEKAAPFLKRALAIDEKFYGAEGVGIAKALLNLANLYRNTGQPGQALTLTRRISAIYRQRIMAGGSSDAAVREAQENRPGFLFHLMLLAANPFNEPAEKIADEAFRIVQLEQASGTASAIARMAARFASGDDALAGLVKRKQDAVERRNRLEAQLVSAAGMSPQQRKAEDEQRWRDAIAAEGKDLAGLDAELGRRFPEYQELTRPEPIGISQIRALLRPGEAMLVYTLGVPSYLWVVKPDGAMFRQIKVDVNEVAAKVATVRAEMDFDNAGNPKKLNVRLLHELYLSLFVPALAELAGVQHVMLVPGGPLQSLPFGMLVAAPPPEVRSDADYRQIDWLARHYAFSVLPAVGSIQALRRFAKAGVAPEAFAGFGDPLIGGSGEGTRGTRPGIDVTTVFRNVAAKGGAQTSSPATAIADVEAIRRAPRLMETADELRSMSRVLKAGPNSLWLQEKANETTLKRLDLSRYRTIAFATHGVMAGELKGATESGLILTPPGQGSIEDDGYLSASEIARLKLNADWVLLSACNTAAADGTPGAEGLSGLAKAFFYAGARSLLVSHWPVASEATVPLTTGMLSEYQAHPAQGKAEAQRKAMLALIDTPDHPEYAHPIFWAPFVVVGEGGGAASDPAGRKPAAEAVPGKAVPEKAGLVLAIGNGKYQAPIPELKLPLSNARTFASALQVRGYQADTGLDLDKTQFIAALKRFRQHPAGTKVLYVSGYTHFMDDTNQAFLFPVDASVKTAANWISWKDLLSTAIGPNPTACHLVIVDGKIEAQAPLPPNTLAMSFETGDAIEIERRGIFDFAAQTAQPPSIDDIVKAVRRWDATAARLSGSAACSTARIGAAP